MTENLPPKLTPEERRAALETAMAARVKRAEIRSKIASGELSVADQHRDGKRRL